MWRWDSRNSTNWLRTIEFYRLSVTWWQPLGDTELKAYISQCSADCSCLPLFRHVVSPEHSRLVCVCVCVLTEALTYCMHFEPDVFPVCSCQQVFASPDRCLLEIPRERLGICCCDRVTMKPVCFGFCYFLFSLSLQRPWHEYEHNFQIMYKVGMGHKPPIPERLSPEGKAFLSHCLESDPKIQWTASQLLDHAFVKVCTDEE